MVLGAFDSSIDGLLEGLMEDDGRNKIDGGIVFVGKFDGDNDGKCDIVGDVDIDGSIEIDGMCDKNGGDDGIFVSIREGVWVGIVEGM